MDFAYNSANPTFTWGNQLPATWSEAEPKEGHTLACARYPVRKLVKFDENGYLIDAPSNLLPAKFIEALEQNQQIASCCRHPENHDIEAFFTCEEERSRGTPDLYIMHCTCGRQHRRLMCGGGDRPYWNIR